MIKNDKNSHNEKNIKHMEEKKVVKDVEYNDKGIK